ncbi:MAG: 4Fe-4S binding protein [Candidatus Omnitrophica bacterium]|nr:4Fe-4S binding protein [Candidatus Omnitrophota bacterium]
MENFKLFEAKRRLRQYGMAFVFVLILIFGWQFPFLGYFIPACMLLGFGMGLMRKRKWCDWYCPRGSFYDALARPLSPQKKIPALFKNIPFRLGALALLMIIMIVNLIMRWPHADQIGFFFIIMLTVTTTLGVILAIIFHQRSWCMICPIGTIINLTGKSKSPLTIDSDKCVECKLCAKACPVQIKPYLFKQKGVLTVNDRDCLQCASCVAACPKKALYFSNAACDI